MKLETNIIVNLTRDKSIHSALKMMIQIKTSKLIMKLPGSGRKQARDMNVMTSSAGD